MAQSEQGLSFWLCTPIPCFFWTIIKQTCIYSIGYIQKNVKENYNLLLLLK